MQSSIETINLNLPESRIGKFAIKKKLLRKGSYCDIVNKREAFFTGQRSTSKILETDLIIDVLSETGYGTWIHIHKNFNIEMKMVIGMTLWLDGFLKE
jgi:hypothetical protein